MTDTTIAADKPPTDPRPPCDICGSQDHPTGHHESDEPTGGGTSSPTGHHES